LTCKALETWSSAGPAGAGASNPGSDGRSGVAPARPGNRDRDHPVTSTSNGPPPKGGADGAAARIAREALARTSHHHFGVRELAPAFSTADSSAVGYRLRRVAASQSGDESPHSKSFAGANRKEKAFPLCLRVSVVKAISLLQLRRIVSRHPFVGTESRVDPPASSVNAKRQGRNYFLEPRISGVCVRVAHLRLSGLPPTALTG
jgi:hypothetical protein